MSSPEKLDGDTAVASNDETGTTPGLFPPPESPTVATSDGDPRHDTVYKSPGSERYHDLDALRAILMMWGIVVHTSTLSDSFIFDNAARISGWVRMEAFFTISGLFASLLVKKYGATRMVARRVLSLGVPLAATLILLNPVTNYLIYLHHNEYISIADFLVGSWPHSPKGPIVWHLHLWFLVSLFCYSLVAPLIASSFESASSALRRNFDNLSEQGAFSLLCIWLPVSCLVCRIVFEVVGEPYLPVRLQFIGKATLYYFPFFLMGMALFQSKRLKNAFLRVHWFHIIAGVGGLVAVQSYFSLLPKLYAETLKLLADAYLGLTLTSMLFYSFRRFFNGASRMAVCMSDAAYTVYLLHYIVIYALALALKPILGVSDLLLFVVAIITFGITIVIHRWIIVPAPLLRALFNGKFVESRPNAIGVVTVHGEVSGERTLSR